MLTFLVLSENSLEFIKPESKGLHKALDRAEELFDEGNDKTHSSRN